jgi:hypothetical protein
MKKTKAKLRRRAVIPVFGENDHDRRAIRRLASGLRPDLAKSIEVRRAPLVLIKNTLPRKARANAVEIAKVVAQERAARDVVAVLAHEDCDEMEPAHEGAARRIEAELAAAGCPGVHVAVTPAWETEAWWLLFPEAVAEIVEGWEAPDGWLGTEVGRVADAKEALAKAVRPAGKRKVRAYHEADSVAIAEKIVELGLLESFAGEHRKTSGKGVASKLTKSASFGAFRAKILALPELLDGFRVQTSDDESATDARSQMG